jgi:hypothetical protein
MCLLSSRFIDKVLAAQVAPCRPILRRIRKDDLDLTPGIQCPPLATIGDRNETGLASTKLLGELVVVRTSVTSAKEVGFVDKHCHELVLSHLAKAPQATL